MFIAVFGFPLFLNFVTQENRENLKNYPKFHFGFVICVKLLELENKTNHSA
jgi:hypothetical protein